MLYDQAQLAVAYSSAYTATKHPLYADIVRDILTYVNRDLSDKVNFNTLRAARQISDFPFKMWRTGHQICDF
jgi:uncharacterized protein YyaL (SSP411 family)